MSSAEAVAILSDSVKEGKERGLIPLKLSMRNGMKHCDGYRHGDRIKIIRYAEILRMIGGHRRDFNRTAKKALLAGRMNNLEYSHKIDDDSTYYLKGALVIASQNRSQPRQMPRKGLLHLLVCKGINGQREMPTSNCYRVLKG